MSINIPVTKDDELLNYLFQQELHYSRSKLKSLLKHECISIDHEVTTQFNDPVSVGQVIRIVEHNKSLDTSLKVIYEDADILVIDKPYGLLTIATNKDEDMTAYRLASAYVKTQNQKNKIFVVHRLDKDTSGVLLFAKSERAKKAYQADWNKLVSDRTYVAVVEGTMTKESGTVESFLQENKTTHMYSTHTGLHAITHFKVIKASTDNSILKVNIDTGRKNQIRVHLADLKHPIIGDKKYGATTNPIKRLGLHAYRITLTNPINKKEMSFVAALPPKLRKISKITKSQEEAI